MTDESPAILLMAYGTPDTLDAVGPYFTHIRGGRTPSADAIEHLRSRYARVGGATPLLAITRVVRERLTEAFAASGDPRQVYVGMKHWHPYIVDTVRQMAIDGVHRATAIVLAPHYSRMSIGGYRKSLDDARRELSTPLDVHFIERWGAASSFRDLMTDLVRDGLALFPDDVRTTVTVVFSAHSLPVRIREWNDPYEAELLDSSRRVAERLALTDWRFAWQSAGGTGEPWIGPDILDYLETLHHEGVRHVLQVPIGFVSEHLEILYDIDIEAQEKAAQLGMTLRRSALPNADPRFIRALATIVRDAEAIAVPAR
ncbi:MAG: ferrochelatase [Gemmatimonadaceae bacterium]